MPRSSAARPYPAAWFTLALLSTLAVLFAPRAHAAKRAKLGVLVVFDQMRATDLTRMRAAFGPRGFGGLEGSGAAIMTGSYAHAVTETGPGHATLATGAAPNVHGIVANHVYADGKSHYIVADPAHPVLGRPAYGAGPKNLAVGTLGDAMKLASLGKAKVVTLSIKDRAAILTAGHAADVALWYDTKLGQFTTSTAYADALPAWASPVNAQVTQSLKTGMWSPLDDTAAVWSPLAAGDKNAHEAHRYGFSDTFPHDLKALPTKDAQKAYRATPQAMNDLFDLAIAAVDGEQLGADDTPDLLVVSVSSTDYASHWFGPMSAEVVDITRRASSALGGFVAALDARLGKDGYVIAVSADHGGMPLPERAASLGVPAGRISAPGLKATAEDALKAALGKDARVRTAGDKPASRVRGFSPPHLFLALEDLAPAEQHKAKAAVSAAIQAIPHVAAVYDPSALATSTDPYAEAYLQSVFGDRAGALLVRQDPRFIWSFKGETDGTDHGTPYAYDRRVPLLMRGPGLKAGFYPRDVDVRQLAPTMAAILGMPPPDGCTAAPVPALRATQTRF